MTRSTRQIFLGIKVVDGEERWTRAGVMRVVKTLFLIAFLGLNVTRLYMTESFHLLQHTAVQSLVLSTFLLTYGYYKTKPEVLKLVDKEGLLIEEGEE